MASKRLSLKGSQLTLDYYCSSRSSQKSTKRKRNDKTISAGSSSSQNEPYESSPEGKRKLAKHSTLDGRSEDKMNGSSPNTSFRPKCREMDRRGGESTLSSSSHVFNPRSSTAGNLSFGSRPHNTKDSLLLQTRRFNSHLTGKNSDDYIVPDSLTSEDESIPDYWDEVDCPRVNVGDELAVDQRPDSSLSETIMGPNKAVSTFFREAEMHTGIMDEASLVIPSSQTQYVLFSPKRTRSRDSRVSPKPKEKISRPEATAVSGSLTGTFHGSELTPAHGLYSADLRDRSWVIPTSQEEEKELSLSDVESLSVLPGEPHASSLGLVNVKLLESSKIEYNPEGRELERGFQSPSDFFLMSEEEYIENTTCSSSIVCLEMTPSAKVSNSQALSKSPEKSDASMGETHRVSDANTPRSASQADSVKWLSLSYNNSRSPSSQRDGTGTPKYVPDTRVDEVSNSASYHEEAGSRDLYTYCSNTEGPKSDKEEEYTLSLEPILQSSQTQPDDDDVDHFPDLPPLYTNPCQSQGEPTSQSLGLQEGDLDRELRSSFSQGSSQVDVMPDIGSYGDDEDELRRLTPRTVRKKFDTAVGRGLRRRRGGSSAETLESDSFNIIQNFLDITE